MSTKSAARLARFISSLPDLNCEPENRTGYGHMGATLTDAILQPGLNYRTVVYPRVQSVIGQFPTAITTTAFSNVLNRCTPARVLNWSHPEKPRRLRELTDLLRHLGIETEEQLRAWVGLPSTSEILLSVKGVGPKTVDYIKLLVGLSTIAVDRHIRTFVEMAGLQIDDYEELRGVVIESAEILEIEPSTLDHSIWRYLSR
jgi:hypothetical protein